MEDKLPIDQSDRTSIGKILLREAQALALAVSMLTRVPVPTGSHLQSLAKASKYFPLAGVLVGAFGGFILWLCNLAALPPFVSAVLALAATAWFTRGLHEDGLADMVDGLGGGKSRDRKLEIMRDSHIGAFGVLALILVFAVKWAALSSLLVIDLWPTLLALLSAAVLSRFAFSLLMHVMPTARSDGLAHAAGRPTLLSVSVAGAITLLICLCLWNIGAILLAILGFALAVLWVALAAGRQIGGVTGDILGAAQQVSEATILVGVLVAWRI